MTLEIIECEQRSDAWYAARRGMVTASVVGSLVSAQAKTGIDYACPKCKVLASDACRSIRGGITGDPIKTIHPERTAVASKAGETVLRVADGDTFKGLVAALAAERIDDEIAPSFMNADLERGVLYEPVMRDRYAEVHGVTVREVGLMVRTFPSGARLGCSPDGLVGEDGGIECKAPRAKGQVQTVLADEVPGGYMAQVQAALLVSGREWWDYLSAAAGRLYVKRVLPDKAWHDAITEAVTAAETAIEKACSDYLIRAESLPTIAPYVNPYDLELSI